MRQFNILYEVVGYNVEVLNVTEQIDLGKGQVYEIYYNKGKECQGSLHIGLNRGSDIYSTSSHEETRNASYASTKNMVTSDERSAIALAIKNFKRTREIVGMVPLIKYYSSYVSEKYPELFI